MSNKQQTAVEWLIDKLDNNLDINHSWRTRQYIQQAKELEKQQNIICKDCGEVITLEQINNHSFMKIKGGGLIHWNCN